MKAKEAVVAPRLETDRKPCVICKVSCMPYARTRFSGHLCGKACSTKYDSLDVKEQYLLE